MKKQFKTKYTWEDFEVGDNFPADEAVKFVENVKPLLLNKKLEKVLIKGICNNSLYYDDKMTYKESIRHTKEKCNYDCLGAEEDTPRILQIGGNQLEIDLWQPERYELSLNMITPAKIVDISEIPVKEMIDNYSPNDGVFYDVTNLYEDSIIGQKIVDIAGLIGKYEDNSEYLEKLIITFENGKKAIIEDIIDTADMKIV